MEKKVIAIDGLEYDKSQCKKIKGDYWKIGDPLIENSGHCYLINDKYYKYNTGYIVYDNLIKSYVIKNMSILISNGVISIDEKGLPVFGSFSKTIDNENLLLNYKGYTYNLINEDIVKDSIYYKESLQDGIYYERNKVKALSFITPVPCNQNYKQSLNYDSKNDIKQGIEWYDQYNNSTLNSTVEKYGKVIKDYTFGFEFETTQGFVPERINKKLGLIPLRDGSINGLEYVTIPLKDKKGLQSLIDSVSELNKRTEYDESCSLHLHIGGIPRTEKFFLALFKLLIATEEEFFSLFPIYKKYNYGVKRKNYTKAFPINETIMLMDPVINDTNIKQNFNVLFNFLSMGYDYNRFNSNLDDVKSHPSDPNGMSKWNIKSRYHYVNLIPLLYGNKKTVEFRIHTPTLDVNKIVNYLIMCVSILEYAKVNQDAILSKPNILNNIKLKDIVFQHTNKYSDYVTNELFKYMAARQSYIYNRISSGDIVCNERNFYYKPYSVDWEDKKKNKYAKDISSIKYYIDNVDRGVQYFADPIPVPGVRRGRPNRVPNPLDIVHLQDNGIQEQNVDDILRELVNAPDQD